MSVPGDKGHNPGRFAGRDELFHSGWNPCQARRIHARRPRIGFIDHEGAGGERSQRTAKDKGNTCLHMTAPLYIQPPLLGALAVSARKPLP